MKKRQFDRRKKLMADVLANPAYRPMRLRELAALLDIPRTKRKELYQVMDALVEEGYAKRHSNGTYTKAEITCVSGIFLAHPKGFGFVDVGEGEEDIFIPEDQTPSSHGPGPGAGKSPGENPGKAERRNHCQDPGTWVP